MRKHKATCFRYLLWAAVLFWAGMIFYMSAQNAGSSNAMSGGLLQRITALFPVFRRMAAEERAQLLSLLHTLLRKAAHWFSAAACFTPCRTSCISISSRGEAASFGMF